MRLAADTEHTMIGLWYSRQTLTVETGFKNDDFIAAWPDRNAGTY